MGTVPKIFRRSKLLNTMKASVVLMVLSLIALLAVSLIDVDVSEDEQVIVSLLLLLFSGAVGLSFLVLFASLMAYFIVHEVAPLVRMLADMVETMLRAFLPEPTKR